MIKNITLVLLLLISSLANAEIVRRGAFDMGSGKLKLQVSDVDLDSGTIVDTVFSDSIQILLKDDLDRGGSGSFSAQIEEKLLNGVIELMDRARPFNPEAYTGVATEAFRQAHNGPDMLRRIEDAVGIPMRVISQAEEGQLGLKSVELVSSPKQGPLIVLDMGGASFQVSTFREDGFHFYAGRLGRQAVKNLVITEVKGKSLEEAKTPNPLSSDEITRAMKVIKDKLADPELWLQQALSLSDNGVLGVGTIHAFIEQYLGKSHYTKQEVLTLLEERIGLDDAALSEHRNEPASAVTELIFLYALMDRLGIDNVEYIKIIGLTPGMLTSPQYWEVRVKN